ncbi:MAG: adenine phosphoribosyltransferase [Synechococcaceae cyanobacterium]|nr:adenine phosphoribosyltransferase [Synechococcaceae cyanobacterium]
MSAAAGTPSHPSAEPSTDDLRALVREIPDFPKPGILFRDLSPLLREPEAWAAVVRRLGAICDRLQPELIVGIESRGFIVGVALATARGIGFVKARKPGKLPPPVVAVEYELEYGSDKLEILSHGYDHRPRVLIVDDLLATGGTAAACAELVRQVGGELCGLAFVIELAELGGRERLPAGVPVESLIVY